MNFDLRVMINCILVLLIRKCLNLLYVVFINILNDSVDGGYEWM